MFGNFTIRKNRKIWFAPIQVDKKVSLKAITRVLIKPPEVVEKIIEPYGSVRSKTHIRSCNTIWGEFHNWALTHPDDHLAYQLEGFMHSLLGRGLKVSTVLIYLSRLSFVLRQIAKYTGDLQIMSYVAFSMQLVILPNRDHNEDNQIWLSAGKVKEILNSPNTQTLVGKRDRVILMLLLGMGLRSNEVANLKWEQIGGEDRSWILTVKSKKRSRTIPMPSGCQKAIADWGVAVRHSYSGYVLAHIRGGIVQHWGLSTRGIYGVVRKYDEDANPRLCRRTFAHHAWRGGMDLFDLARYLGHSYPTLTEVYLGVCHDSAQMKAINYLEYSDCLQ
jgi:integrase